MLRVQKRMCATCVYRKGSPLDPRDLEDRIRTPFGDFNGFRICHSSKTACCAGFWARHKDKFSLGQIAQRLGFVEFVQDNVATRISQSVKRGWRDAGLTPRQKKR